MHCEWSVGEVITGGPDVGEVMVMMGWFFRITGGRMGFLASEGLGIAQGDAESSTRAGL